MKIGVPREVKVHEYRVAITPAGVNEFVHAGHEVLIERDAGLGSSIEDTEYIAAGARILNCADDVWAEADLLLKVKEPVAEEFHRLRAGTVLFTYLHLAASRECTGALVESGIRAVAYETVQLSDGSLPLLHPMSEVAGWMAPQVGAYCLQREAGGRGILLGGVTGVSAAKVAVLGAGVAGMNAVAGALGLWADTVVLDKDISKLRRLDQMYRGRVQTLSSNRYDVEKACLDADLVIGAILVPGAKAPKLVSNELVRSMKPGSVLVDISVDQGGCFEGSHPTTHAAPTFNVYDTVFYCVANMPGAVPHTSTYALTNATLPYALELANCGLQRAVAMDPALKRGVNVMDGRITYQPVAAAHDLPYVCVDDVLI